MLGHEISDNHGETDDNPVEHDLDSEDGDIASHLAKGNPQVREDDVGLGLGFL